MFGSPFVTVCGLWGLLGSLSWSFAKKRRTMLAIMLCTQPGYGIYWAGLGDATAAAMSVLAMLLTLLSAGLGGPEGSAMVRWTRRAFMAALIPVAGISLLTWDGLPSAFAAAGMALGCAARWQADGTRFQRLMLSTNLPWLAHDLMAGSAPALASDLFGLARAAWIGVAEFRRRRPAALRGIAVAVPA